MHEGSSKTYHYTRQAPAARSAPPQGSLPPPRGAQLTLRTLANDTGKRVVGLNAGPYPIPQILSVALFERVPTLPALQVSDSE